MHISRNSVPDSDDVFCYTLHFDPEQDDSLLNDKVKCGHVLGYSSLFVAFLVQSLVKTCIEEPDGAYLSDLPIRVCRIMPSAVLRCQQMSLKAYGSSPDEFQQIASVDNKWFNPGLVKPTEPAGKETALVPIAKVGVPQVSLRNWSILLQSTQTRIGEVARQIVMYGVDGVLNQPTPKREHVCDALFDAIIDNMRGGDIPPDEEEIRELVQVARIAVFEKGEIVGKRSPDSLVDFLPEKQMQDWDPIVNLIKKKLDPSLLLATTSRMN